MKPMGFSSSNLCSGVLISPNFSSNFPNVPNANVYARIIMTPMNAKLLHRALGQNLEKFEEKFGEIKTPEHKFEEEKPIGFIK